MQSILRWDREKALVLDFDGNKLKYSQIREMPVSDSMFRILKYKNKYFLVSNRKPKDFDASTGSFRRSILSLFMSEDLKKWELIEDIIDYGDKDMMKFGFQYPSAFIYNDTMYLLIRSAYNEAYGYHDSNTMLFTKIDLTRCLND